MRFTRLLLLGILAFPLSAGAVSLDFETTSFFPGAGDSLEVTLSIAPDGGSVNALEGEVLVPEGLEVLEVRYGTSVVPLWLTPPRAGDGRISFAGIIPGGWPQGALEDRAALFTFILSARSAGAYALSLASSTAVFRNDGLGTPAEVRATPLLLRVGADQQDDRKVFFIKDTIPPEPFTPLISQSEHLFDGDFFVAFNATDRESGLSRYEIAEARSERESSELRWREATSPERLIDQTLRSIIYIKAIDQAGNERIATLSPHTQNVSPWALLFLAILLITAVAGSFLKIWWQKYIH